MGSRVPRLDDRIESFVMGYWDTDVRGVGSGSEARHDSRVRGIYDAVRRFLLDVIRRNAVTVEEWGDLCNIQVDSMGDVRADAEEFWDWLFDGEPLPGTSGPTGPVQPPQG